ncbi:MAG: hypothetical protein H6Q28_1790, partial [Bacteroidetes bacterium]|nr:hypothetical protein [Bacteroidota bacterium]
MRPASPADAEGHPARVPRSAWPIVLLAGMIVAAAAAPGHAQEIEPPRGEAVPLLESLRNPDAVVARVGPLKITAREFFFSYIFGPAFPKRGSDSRRGYLDLMVNEKLLALGAKERGLEEDPRVTSALAQLEGDFATEELYRDDVLSSVNVAESEIDRAVAEEQETVSLRWLFFSSAEEAGRTDTVLRSGKSFDSLFFEHLAVGRVRKEDRMSTTSRFRLARQNAALASVVRDLPVRVPSAPVAAPDGWYVVQVDSVHRRPVVTESEDAELRLSARRALTQTKADSLSGEYVRLMMLDADPVIQRRIFDILRAWIGSRRLSPERFEAFGLAGRFRAESDTVDYKNIRLYADSTLVVTRQENIALGAFLAWYEPREALTSLRWTSPQSFFLSLEDIVWRMVRDHVLVRRARARGLQDRPSVAEQTGWWQQKLLYQAEKDVAAKSIGWSDSTLKAHHAAHP